MVSTSYRYQVRAAFGPHRGTLARTLTLTEARAYVRHYVAQGLQVVSRGGPLVIVDQVEGYLSYDGGKPCKGCGNHPGGSLASRGRWLEFAGLGIGLPAESWELCPAAEVAA